MPLNMEILEPDELIKKNKATGLQVEILEPEKDIKQSKAFNVEVLSPPSPTAEIKPKTVPSDIPSLRAPSAAYQIPREPLTIGEKMAAQDEVERPRIERLKQIREKRYYNSLSPLEQGIYHIDEAAFRFAQHFGYGAREGIPLAKRTEKIAEFPEAENLAQKIGRQAGRFTAYGFIGSILGRIAIPAFTVDAFINTPGDIPTRTKAAAKTFGTIALLYLGSKFGKGAQARWGTTAIRSGLIKTAERTGVGGTIGGLELLSGADREDALIAGAAAMVFPEIGAIPARSYGGKWTPEAIKEMKTLAQREVVQNEQLKRMLGITTVQPQRMGIGYIAPKPVPKAKPAAIETVNDLVRSTMGLPPKPKINAELKSDVQSALREVMGLPETSRKLKTEANKELKEGAKEKLEEPIKYETLTEEQKIRAAARIRATHERGETALGGKYQVKPINLYYSFKRAIAGQSANLQNWWMKQGELGKIVVREHDLVKGAQPSALSLANNYFQKNVKPLNAREREVLDSSISSQRDYTISQYKPGHRFTENRKGWEHRAYIEKLAEIENISKESVAKVLGVQRRYFNSMFEALDLLYKNEIITEASFKNMASKGDYSPKQFLDFIDPEVTYENWYGRGRARTVSSSGLKPLEEGHEGYLMRDSLGLLKQVYVRTLTRIAKQSANKAMAQAIDPTNPKAIKSDLFKPAEFDFEAKKYKKAPPGYTTISYMEKGLPRNMWVERSMAKEWIESDPAITSTLANFLSLISGTTPVKIWATGINPEFALRNIWRDPQYIFWTTGEYSSVAPIAINQMRQDLTAVFKDAVTERGAWNEYLKDGGGMGFLSSQGWISAGNLGRSIRQLLGQPPKASIEFEGTLQAVAELGSKPGNISERWTRLALRRRSIINQTEKIREQFGRKPTPEEMVDIKRTATWISRTYLDFAQGGWLSKFLDVGIPYFGAGTQATRGLIRAAKRDPKTFTFKALQMMTLRAGLVMACRLINPDGWKNITPESKKNYWILVAPPSFSYRDSKGNLIHRRLQIPMDQGQRVVAAVTDAIVATALGEETDASQIWNATRDALSILPEMNKMLPPSLDAAIGYKYHLDTWFNRSLTTERERRAREPTLEKDEFTHPLAVKAAEALGLSPKRLEYAWNQLFPVSNFFIGLSGLGAELVLKGIPEEDRETFTKDLMGRMPGPRAYFKNTYPYYVTAEKFRKEAAKEYGRRELISQPFEELVSRYQKARKTETRKEILTYIGKQNARDQKWLKSYVKARLKIPLKVKPPVQEPVWWAMLISSETPVATRAQIYHEQRNQFTPAEQRKMDGYARRLGLFTKDFRWEYRQVKKGY